MKSIINDKKNGMYMVIFLFALCGAIIFYAIYKYTNKKESSLDSSNFYMGNCNMLNMDKIHQIAKNEVSDENRKIMEAEDSELVLPTPDKYIIVYGTETRATSRMVNKPPSALVPNNILSGNASFIPDYSNLSI